MPATNEIQTISYAPHDAMRQPNRFQTPVNHVRYGNSVVVIAYNNQDTLALTQR
jgi:hypothetical protein